MLYAALCRARSYALYPFSARIAEPSRELSWFSVTAVYMNSVPVYRGQYHQHPYGELNLVVPLDLDAKLMGPRGWSGPGWTAPGPGSHHYPEVKGGALAGIVELLLGRLVSPLVLVALGHGARGSIRSA